MEVKMNILDILQTQQELARGEHSLEEVLQLAAAKAEADQACPVCGMPLKGFWYWHEDWRGELECSKCGWTASF